MFALLLALLACAGQSDDAVSTSTTDAPVFDGYHVRIKLLMTDENPTTLTPELAIIDMGGTSQLIGSYPLTRMQKIPEPYFEIEDVLLPADQIGEAMNIGVVAKGPTFTISRVWVDYHARTTDNIPVYPVAFSQTSYYTCGDDSCGSIEAKGPDDLGRWRFNIVGVTKDAIPTAVINIPSNHQP